MSLKFWFKNSKTSMASFLAECRKACGCCYGWQECTCSHIPVFTMTPHSATLDDESNYETMVKLLTMTEEKFPSGILDDEIGQDVYDTVGPNNWACRSDRIEVRVFGRGGGYTMAWRKAYALACRLQDHPLLDEDDVSRRESEAEWEQYGQEVDHLESLFFDEDSDRTAKLIRLALDGRDTCGAVTASGEGIDYELLRELYEGVRQELLDRRAQSKAAAMA